VQASIDWEPPHNGTATSRAAAVSMQTHTARIRNRILDFIKSRHSTGATAHEIEVMLEIPGNTCRPRLIELRKLGQIKDSGLTRKTSTRRNAVVWLGV
jgi:hypothetical protein